MQEHNNHIVSPSVFLREFGRENALWGAIAVLMLIILGFETGQPLRGLLLATPVLFAANMLAWMALSINQDIFKP